MKQFVKFILIGLLFATVGEFVLNILILNSLSDYLFTFIIYFLLLVFIYYSSKIINFLFRKKLTANIIYYLTYSLLGLMIEWFLLGNSPSGNPDANQIGMFSFWAAVCMMPRIFTDKNKNLIKLKKSVILFFIPYSVIMLIAGILLPASSKLFLLVWLITIGYTFMNIFYVIYFIKSVRAARLE